MSPSKRRKLGVGSPSQAPVSAIAARRQLAANALEGESSSAEGFTPTENSFSALQLPKPNSETMGTSKKHASQLPSRRKDHSSFSLSKQNHDITADGAMKLRLDQGERFIILGSFGLRVLSGEVKVAGATLRASSPVAWMKAPHCLALPVIRTMEACSLELIQDPSASNLIKLGRLSPLFRKIWNEPTVVDEGMTAAQSSFKFIGTSTDVPKKCVIQELTCYPGWNKMLESIECKARTQGPMVTLVCGPKSSGKSTFARLLTNHLLTSAPKETGPAKPVAVLDLDPGQAEFAPPGTISLIRVSRPNLGPPFTHSVLDDAADYSVLRCHSLASVTPASSPGLYVACATDLYQRYQSTLRDCSLVVNTPGWILGTGLYLLVELMSLIRPSEVVYTSMTGPDNVVETLQGAAKHSNFSTVESQSAEKASRTAAHRRSMQAMSYFHSQVTSAGTYRESPSICWFAQPLMAIRPYVVRYQGNNSGILGILCYEYQPPPDLLAEYIDGSIVAVVDIEDAAALRDLDHATPTLAAAEHRGGDAASVPTPTVARTKEGLPYLANATDAALDPRFCQTIGLALIRGIDTSNKCLQIVTPLLMSKLADVRLQGRSIVLVQGKFDRPDWAYTEALFEKSYQEGSEKELEVSDAEIGDDEIGDVEMSDWENSDGGDEATVPMGSSSDGGGVSTVPWIETLEGSQKRPVGSRVSRVRRDLGRNNAG